MKNFSLLLLSAAVAVGTLSVSAKKPTVIDRPVVEAANTSIIEIGRIEASDTATVLYFEAKFRPKYWIKVVSGTHLAANNQTFGIRWAKGIELDSLHWMPESGRDSFVIAFDPLPKGSQSFDFTEGKDKDSFGLYGVQLNNKGLQKPTFAYHTPDSNAPLEAPTVAYDKATLKGKIFGWRPGLPMPQLQQYTMFDSEPVERPLNVADDGTFSIEATNAYTWRAFIWSTSFPFSALLSPGKTTTVYIDLPSATRRASFLNEQESEIQYAWFEGPYAVVNNEMNRLGRRAPSNERIYPIDSLLAHGNMDQIAEWHYVQYEKAVKGLDTLQVAPATRTFFAEQLKAQLLYNFALSDYLVGQAYDFAHKKQRPDSLKNLLPQAKHFEPLKTMQFNTLSFPLFGDPNRYTLDVIGTAVNPNHTSEGIKTFFGPSAVVDVGLASTYASQIKAFDPLTDQELEILTTKTTVLTSLGAMATEYNTQLKATLQANKSKTGYTICEAPAVNDSTLFDALMAPYAGKVVFVDFWATWCGPCRSAMKDAEPVKAALQGKEVVYVYLTSPSSPMGTWRNMIPDIHGDHYMLTQEQWRTLCDQFGVQGIPSYVVVGRDGKVKHFQTGFMGASKMKELLEKEL